MITSSEHPGHPASNVRQGQSIDALLWTLADCWKMSLAECQSLARPLQSHADTMLSVLSEACVYILVHCQCIFSACSALQVSGTSLGRKQMCLPANIAIRTASLKPLIDLMQEAASNMELCTSCANFRAGRQLT